ncbi:MAG: vitamin K epoxide reductase family protein [Bacteroidota bacterium]
MLKKRRDPLAIVIYELFLLLEAKIAFSSIQDRLLQHPKYPSLFSITNTLDYFGLKNKAVKIELKQLSKLEVPFLVPTNTHGTILVKSVYKNDIKYWNMNQGWRLSSIKEFKRYWEDVVILVDLHVRLEEKDYSIKKNQERLLSLRLPIAVTIILILLLTVFFGFETILQKLLFTGNIIGLTISILLVKKEIVKKTNYSFCKIGKKIDCDEVLNSKAAKIFTWLSLSDIGLLYFSSGILMFLADAVNSNYDSSSLVSLIALSYLPTLPLTFYSLYYQGFIIKKWCILCVSIIALLWLNSAIGYFIVSSTGLDFSFSRISLLTFGFSFLLPSVIWMFLKGIFKKAELHNISHYDMSRIKNDLSVFPLFLEKQESTTMDFQENEIVFGNYESKNLITVVINPFCPACGREYNHIYQLLQKYPDFANVIVRFVGRVNSLDKNRVYASMFLIDKYFDDKSSFAEVLKEWFRINNMTLFIKKYHTEHKKESEKILEYHYQWSEKVNIEVTPISYFNNKKLDFGISIERISMMLDMVP